MQKASIRGNSECNTSTTASRLMIRNTISIASPDDCRISPPRAAVARGAVLKILISAAATAVAEAAIR